MERSPHDQGERVIAALEARADNRAKMVDQRLREHDQRGRYLPVLTDDDWQEVLDRVANGAIPKRVMEGMGSNRSALTAKRKRDPEFDARFREAWQDGYEALAEDIRLVVRNEPGYGTGDLMRDALVAKYDLALAQAIAHRTLGKQVDVNHKTVIRYTIKDEDRDW